MLLQTSALVVLAVAGVFATWRYLDPPPGPVPPQDPLFLHDVTLLQPGVGRLAHVDVRVSEGRVDDVTSSDPAARGAELPYEGAFVSPGLIDMHFHIPPWWAPGQVELFDLLLLLHGVTSIREMGSIDRGAFELRESIRRGERAGPRVFACGEILDGEPPTWPFARVVRTEKEAKQAVADLADSGADCIKVYAEVTPNVLSSLRAAASSLGLPLVGHLPRSAPWVETRIGDIQHVCDPRCWAMSAEDADDLVRAAELSHLAHTPTLVVYAMQLEMYDYARARARPSARRLPGFWRDVLWNPHYRLGFEPPDAGAAEQRTRHAALLRRLLELVGRMHRRGVRLHAGTDPPNPLIVPGASLHDELRLMVEAGLTVEEAWVTATTAAGDSLGEPGLGTLSEGAPADLLIFEEDPTKDLSALSTLAAVVADGRLYTRAALEADFARQRRHFEGRAFDGLTKWVARVIAEAARRHDAVQ
jgi:imidazolonepropionase-like amidohydrolase